MRDWTFTDWLKTIAIVVVGSAIGYASTLQQAGRNYRYADGYTIVSIEGQDFVVTYDAEGHERLTQMIKPALVLEK